MNRLNSFAILLFVGSSIALADSATSVQNLLRASPGAPQSLEAVRTLQEGGPEAEALRGQLVQALRTAETPRDLEYISDLLSRSQKNTGYEILLDRMNGGELPMRVAAIRAIRAQLFRKVTISTETRRTTLDRLSALIGDKKADYQLRTVALEALSALGSDGFDAIVKELEKGRLTGLSSIYTAIGATGDPRALTVLRDVVRDPASPDGDVMQALAAAGELFREARAAGRRPVPPDQVAAWEDTLRPLFDRDEQVVAEALKAWGQLHGPSQDPGFRRSMLAAIKSPSPFLKVAALEQIAQGMLPIDAEILEEVNRLNADKQQPDTVRVAADAVLARHRHAQEGTLP